jgi:Tol biopolymer transport system component/predicted Ser/Thr protein kinase
LLTPGQKLGPYEIDSPLGAGGMGEVYRARDTRLERTVAIKVLPSHLSSNPDLKQRFEREAKAISSLNHPRICQLYDVGSQDGVDFLVMEYLEGETLAKRLEKGALPLEQVLKIGAELAEALDKAHRAGIVHRDLKPGNVMLTKSGAKLMDFGLAKSTPGGFAGAGGSAPLLSAAMTMTSPSPRQSPLTSAGAVVGTIQYMSPEQIEGKEADARSDIFALGAVLYEMATGRRAFEGKSQLSVASAILEKDPEPLSATQPTAPPAFDLVIRTCLAKDPDERFQTAHDLMLQLRWLAQPSTSSAAAAQPAMPARSPRTRAIWATVAILALAVAGLAGYLFAPAALNTRPLRALIEPPDKFTFDMMGDYSGPLVLSPQGDKIAFCAHGPNSPKALWVRQLDSFVAQRLEGTEGAYGPFWSPDGRFIGFFANGKLNRIAAAGGPLTPLADALNARGGTWGAGDVILMAPDIQSPIVEVSANGGKVSPVTKVDSSKHTTHRWPVFLLDGKHFLYLATNHNGGKPEDNGIFYASLDGKENHMLIASDAGGEYASGYLLYHSGTALMAQAFDPGAGRLTGEAVGVVGKIRHDSGVWRTLFTVSQTGMLAYEPGSAETAGSQLVWFDRTGKQLGQVGERGSYMDPRISPDGKRVAVSYGDPQREIWIFDLERGTKTRLTFSQATGGVKTQPSWSPDGKTIVFTSGLPVSGGGKTAIYSKSASGSGTGNVILEDTHGAVGYMYGSWSPDGKYFVYLHREGPAGSHVVAKPANGEDQPFTVIAPASPQSNISDYRISPDSKWIAYTSDESGRVEVYVAPFPHGDGKWQVSTGGAEFASWRGDGKEIYISTNSSTYTACSVNVKGNELQIGTPQGLFSANPAAIGVDYDVTADGKRFLVNLAGDEAPSPLHLVLNWTAELKKK